MLHTVNSTQDEPSLWAMHSFNFNFFKPFLDSATQTTLSVTFKDGVA